MEDKDDLLKQLITIQGVGSHKEKRAYIFLRFSAIALTMASGYTTFQGFIQYTPFLIALLLTLGVQGLLYASAWKIGAAIKSNNIKLLQVGIFLLTLVVSVFFSYSSLLEVIYKRDLRLSDEVVNKQNQVAGLVSAIKDSIAKKIDITKTYDGFKENFIVWNDTSSKNVAKSFAELTTMLDKSTSKQKALEYSLYRNRQNFLENPDSINRLLYNRSRLSEASNSENKLFPTLTKRQRCKVLQYEHDSIFRTITENNRLITIGNIANFQQKKKELFSLVLGSNYSTKSTELPDTLKKQLIKISELNNFYDFVDNFKIENYNSIRELKFKALSLIDKLPTTFRIDFSQIKNQLLGIDKYTGPDQHEFVASVMLLKEGHILAIGALTIAFLIDFLVLFCGILGSLPSSYLTLNNRSDIEAVMESSMENVFSINGKDYDSAFKKKLHLIITNCEPASINRTFEGYPAFLTRDKIKTLNLASDIGILVSTSQARTFDGKEDVYLRNRFILWAAEKLNS